MTTHVLAALREKRSQISAQVHDTEAKLAKLRAALANLDAAMNILTPDHPDHVPARRRYKRTNYFSRNELPRLVLDALRGASAPVPAPEIATKAIIAKGLPGTALEVVTLQVLTVLNQLARKGTVTRTGNRRSAEWSISASASKSMDQTGLLV